VRAVLVDPFDSLGQRLDGIAGGASSSKELKPLPVEHVGVDVDVAHGGAAAELAGMLAQQVGTI